MPDNQQKLFQDLPEALVEELLSVSEGIGEQILGTFKRLTQQKQELRNILKEQGFIHKDTDYDFPPIPTTCGIDGSYATEKLLAIDIVACAAVAVEGLTPPSEKRHWPQPHFESFILPISHSEDSGNILRAIMMAFELLLAQDAPHDIVFLDGSLTTPIIYFNQALNKIKENPTHPLADKLLKTVYLSLDAYVEILKSARSDHIWCALPKYSTKREIGEKNNWDQAFNDRAVLTYILEAGECIEPIEMSRPSTPWHLNIQSFLRHDKFKKIEQKAGEIIGTLNNIKVMYYKPYDWMPAFRIEIGAAIAKNRHRISILLQGLKHQCSVPGIMEPYPLYLADRMVKHLGRAIPAIRQVATQNMAFNYEGKMGEIFYHMHGYRTESGRG